MPETPRVIGEFDAYPGMIAALRARIAELDVESS
jgi:hypothetical protein